MYAHIGICIATAIPAFGRIESNWHKGCGAPTCQVDRQGMSMTANCDDVEALARFKKTLHSGKVRVDKEDCRIYLL